MDVAPSAVVQLPETLTDPPAPMGTQFETDKRHLLYFLDQIGNRDLALPDSNDHSSGTLQLLVS